MAEAPAQLALALPHRAALGEDDFIVSDANAQAVGLVDGWPDWPSHAAIIVGPMGSGKTHLASVWALRSQAARFDASEFGEHSLADDATPGNVVLEDVDGDVRDDRAVFHLLNLAREHGRHVLLTARAHPGHMQVALPDLRSRLRSFPVAGIEPPDDALLMAVIVKLLTDRQLIATPPAVNHIVRHMERSMAAAARIVDALDREVWERKAPVTRTLAREVMRNETALGPEPCG